ncbi:hypothetical protein AAHZ94_15045 [Streptomyces sp. HSW2009]|uniref:hypothetical protein n=1 Tax=Streptomyces sp. HSW2009 TaxID=3142890 RepID=UPI0032ED7696
MTVTYGDIAEQQADIVRLLLHEIHGPLSSGRFIRVAVGVQLSGALTTVLASLPR